MGRGVIALVLAGEVSEAVSKVTVSSDNASHDQDEIRSLTDLDIQDLDDISLEESSGVEEGKIKIVMEKSYCARHQAVNALLTHDMNIEDAVKKIRSDKEEVQSFDSSSSVPVIVKPLPSGRIWGQQSEVDTVSFREASSQIGGNADPSGSTLGERVVITASEVFPKRQHLTGGIDLDGDDNVTLGLRFGGEEGNLTFQWTLDYTWAGKHTNLRDYNGKKYSLVKINSHDVNTKKEFFEAMNSLKAGDPVSFTLAKQLYTQGEGMNELFNACRTGEVAIVRHVLASHKEIEINKGLVGGRDLLQLYGVGAGSTPLHVACANDHLSVTQELLNHPDIDVNKRSELLPTPLDTAIINDRPNIVRLLLADLRTDVKPGYNGMTPLHHACTKGNLDIVQQLVERAQSKADIDVNARTILGGIWYTPIMFAARHGLPKIVEYLLTLPSIDLRKTIYNGKNALQIASEEVFSGKYYSDEEAHRMNARRREVVQILQDYEKKKKAEKKEEEKLKEQEKKKEQETKSRRQCIVS